MAEIKPPPGFTLDAAPPAGFTIDPPKDDEEPAFQGPEALRTLGGTLPKPQAPTNMAVARSIVPRFLGQTAEAIGGGIRAYGELLSNPDNPATRLGKKIAAKAQRSLTQDTPDNMGFWQESISEGAVSMLANAPWIATGSAPAALIGMGSQAAATAYQQAREQGLSDESALGFAARQGTIEVATELLPTGFLTKKGMPYAKRFLAQLASDLPGELTSDVLGSINQTLSMNPNATIEEVKAALPGAKDLASTAVSTLVAGGGLTSVGTATDRLMNGKPPPPAQVEPPPRKRFENPHDLRLSEHQTKVKTFKLKPKQAEAFTPKDERDAVTGLFKGEDRVPTIQRAIEHVEQTGEEGAYIEVDLRNLNGVNAKLGHSQTSAKYYRPVVDIVRAELESIGADVIMTRHGGDEFSATIVNATPEAIDLAMEKARGRIQTEIVEPLGISDLPHLKPGSQAGAGIHYGIADFFKGRNATLEEIIGRADRQVEDRKKGAPYVKQGKTGTVGPESPGGQAGGTSGGTPEGDSGVRPEVSAGAGTQPSGQSQLTPEEIANELIASSPVSPPASTPGGTAQAAPTGNSGTQVAEYDAGGTVGADQPNGEQEQQVATPPTPKSVGSAADPATMAPAMLGAAQIEFPLQETGNPKLANPGEGEVRQLVDVADQIRTNTSQPGNISFAESETDADAMLAKDYEGTRKRLLNSGTHTAQDVAAFRKIINKESAEALAGGDTAKIIEATRTIMAYRENGTELARRLAIRRDQHLPPAERNAQFVQNAVLAPDNPRLIAANKAEQEALQRVAEVEKQLADLKTELGKLRLNVAVTRRDAISYEDRLEGAREELARAEARLATAGPKLEAVQAEIAEARKNLAALQSTAEIKRLELQIAKAEKAKAQAEQRRAEAMARKAEALKAYSLEVQEMIAALKKIGIDVSDMKALIADPDRTAAAMRMVQAYRSDGFDARYEYWINSILSAPTTQVANVLGNTMSTAWDFTFQRMAEATVNQLMIRDPKLAQFGEMKYLWKGMNGKVMIDAWRRSQLAFSREMPKLADELGFNGNNRFEEKKVSVLGLKGRIIRIPSRLLVAADEMSKSIIFNMELGAQAYRIAKSEGREGDSLSERIQAIMATPKSEEGALAMARTLGRTVAKDEGLVGSDATKRAKEIATDTEQEAAKRAWEKAEYLTFQSESGKIAESVTHVRSEVAGLRYIIPFVNTPANIISMGLRKSPLGTLGFAYSVAKHGAYKITHSKNEGWKYESNLAVRDAAEQVLAWGAMAAVFAMVAGGDDKEPWLTGSGASFVEKGKKAHEQRKLPPQSFRIGETWYSYARFEPLATSGTILVDAAEAIQEARHGRDISRILVDSHKTLIALVRDKSFLAGMGDIIRAIESPDQAGQWISNFGTSWVPNVIRAGARATDDSVRDYYVVGDGGDWFKNLVKRTAQKAAPIETFAPLPKVDIWGREVTKADGPLSDTLYRAMIPMNRQIADGNRIDRFILAWNNKFPNEGFYPAPPLRYYMKAGQKVEMSEQEYNAFAKESGQFAFKNLDGMGLDPEHPTLYMVELVQTQIALARNVTIQKMFGEKSAEAIEKSGYRKVDLNK